MNENNLHSKKMNLNKKLCIAWCCVAVILVVSLLIVGIKYSPIRKAQDMVIDLTSASVDKFKNFDGNRAELMKKIYNYYQEYFLGLTRHDADRALSEVLKGFGYDSHYYASEYLKEGTMIQYTLRKMPGLIALDVLAIMIVGIAHLLYLSDKKTELYIQNDVIVGKKSNGQTVQFMLKDIKSVESTKTHGLKIHGAGIKYEIHLIENGEELKSTIMGMLATVPKEKTVVATAPVSDASSIKEYKELLDSGIITQEEFEAKKKQLLGL